ncbi:MAG: NAD(P)-dependent oxidoreductase [Burkholderiaceae bacterium]
MRIAILGATGVAGRAFCARALSCGHELAIERVDIFNRDALARFVAGSDAVVNLATSIPKPGGRGSWAENDRIRRDGTAALIAACERAGTPLLVQQSVAMLHCVADDRAQTEEDGIAGYGVLESAQEMEALVLASALDARLVRGGLFYGPGSGREAQWQADLRRTDFRIPGDGSAWMSPVHVADYADALLTVLERGGHRQAYIACDDAPVRVGDLYGRLARQEGLPPPAAGGATTMRSFRVSNAKLRGLGWRATHAVLGD